MIGFHYSACIVAMIGNDQQPPRGKSAACEAVACRALVPQLLACSHLVGGKDSHIRSAFIIQPASIALH